jgi:hypothetical protein
MNALRICAKQRGSRQKAQRMRQSFPETHGNRRRAWTLRPTSAAVFLRIFAAIGKERRLAAAAVLEIDESPGFERRAFLGYTLLLIRKIYKDL